MFHFKAIASAARAALAAAGLFGILLAATPAAANCMDTFMAKLSEMGVAESDIESMSVTTVRNSSAGAGSRVRAYQAWTRLKSCEGYVVVSVSNMCTYRDAHTTGTCRMDGMPTY